MEKKENTGKTDCLPYLNNHKVVHILLKGTNAEKAALNNCFRHLYQALFNKLIGHSSLIIVRGSRDELYAQEAFNDMLAELHRQVTVGQFDPDGKASLPVYLYVIFYRRFWRIRLGSNILVLDNDRVEKVSDSAVIQSAPEAPGGIEHKVKEAIDNCDRGCRELLKLKYLNGLATQEIADQLQLAQQTVKNKLVHCSGQLRNNIKNF